MKAIKRIHFPLEINSFTAKEFTKQFKDSDKHYNEIHLIMRSYGGSTGLSLEIINLIEKSKHKVIAFADSWCDSAATVVFLSCHQRIITSETTMIIHPQKICLDGEQYNDFLDDVKRFERYRNTYIKIYSEKTSLPKERIEKLTLWEEHEFNAREMMLFGMADKMIQPTFSDWGE